MTGDPKSDKIESKDDATAQARTWSASSEPDPDLADQVERVVSLLQKLEALYAQAPAKNEGPSIGHGREQDDRGGYDVEDDFLERFAAGNGDRLGGSARARGLELEDHRQPPPIPGRGGRGAPADPAFYKGALRQHDRELKPKPNLLTKVGLGLAAGLAVLLTLPWLVPAALGPNWRQTLAGVTPADGDQLPPTKVAAPRRPLAAPAESAPIEKIPVESPARNRTVESAEERNAGEGDRAEAAVEEVEAAALDPRQAAKTPSATPPVKAAAPPVKAAPPVEDEASKEDAWRAAALQALLDQRTAWNNAWASGDWSGIAQTAPVDSRTFGEFDPPFSGAAASASASSGGKMAALDDGSPSNDAAALVADTCESANVESDQRAVRLSLADPARTGSQTELVVNDISYRAMFGGDGRLNLEAPRLDETPVLRWVQRDGRVCQRTVPRPVGPASLQFAVMWSGDLGFELDVVEPRSWPGSPTGFITSLAPNTDGSHGAGVIRSFGRTGDPNRALIYAVATEDIGNDGVINVQVKLSPRAEGGGTCGASAEVFTNAEVLYEVYIIHDDGPDGKFRRENRSFAFKVPPCGATAAHQRIERMSIRF